MREKEIHDIQQAIDSNIRKGKLELATLDAIRKFGQRYGSINCFLGIKDWADRWEGVDFFPGKIREGELDEYGEELLTETQEDIASKARNLISTNDEPTSLYDKRKYKSGGDQGWVSI